MILHIGKPKESIKSLLQLIRELCGKHNEHKLVSLVYIDDFMTEKELVRTRPFKRLLNMMY